MNDTVLQQIKEAVRDLLASRQQDGSDAPPDPPAEPDPLFANVYGLGEAIDETQMPLVIIDYGLQRTFEETTNKTPVVLPVMLTVAYSIPAAEALTGQKIDAEAAHLLSELQHMAGNHRQLQNDGGDLLTTDFRFVGGGAEPRALDDDELCRRWAIIAEFEIEYRFQTTDPTVAV